MAFQETAASGTSNSSVSPLIATLADPPVRLMDGSAMDYFLIEMVNTLRISSAVASARAHKIEQDMINAGFLAPPPPLQTSKKENRTSGGSLSLRKPVDDEDEGLRLRLESIGLHVGSNITERLCHDRALFTDTLDTIKFVCKDLWSTCWDKQVDNLRTNHRGIYIVQDNSFKPISRLSSWDGRQDSIQKAKVYVAMPAGIIRGALSRLGLIGVVLPEINNLPQCTFQIKLP